MAVFGYIRGFFGGSGSVFTIIALAAADYLWGENVFICPCGGYRILYTCAFLIVPPVVIILIDVSWKALVFTCKQSCTSGQCCSGAKSTCCDSSTCKTVVRLTARPVIIVVVWGIFSYLEPKFGKCLHGEVSCNCTEAELQNGCSISSKEKEVTIRVVTAVVMLGLTAAVAIILLLFLICGCCCAHTHTSTKKDSNSDCCRTWCDTCYQTRIETGDPKSQRALTRSLYTLGLKLKTVIRLQEQNLMDDRLLVKLSDDAVREIGNSISVGQLKILRKHRRDIRLVKWLLKKYSEDDIRQILEKDDLTGQTWDNVRVPLNNTDTVPDDAAANLRKELGQRHGISPKGDGRNVSRDQKDEQDRKAETGI